MSTSCGLMQFIGFVVQNYNLLMRTAHIDLYFMGISRRIGTGSELNAFVSLAVSGNAGYGHRWKH